MKYFVYSIGVDLGGTWMRIQALDEERRPLKSCRVVAPPLRDLPSELKKIWRQWNIAKPNYLTVAAKGVWTLGERKELAYRLRSLGHSISVFSDIELAFESALTSRGILPGRTPGILILAGTGSIAFGRNSAGQVARTGGLGPWIGDKGSAFWVGREYLRRAPRTLIKPFRGRLLSRSQDSVRRVAMLAKTVLRRAPHDKLCRKIVHEAQLHLAELVMDVFQKLGFRNAAALSWSGGLFMDAQFRSGFFKMLRNLYPKMRFVTVPPRQNPPLAAALWAGSLPQSRNRPFGFVVPRKR